MKLHELFRCYVTEESFEQYKMLDGEACDIKLNAKKHSSEGVKCFIESPGEGKTYEFTDVVLIACSNCCELRFFDVVL